MRITQTLPVEDGIPIPAKRTPGSLHHPKSRYRLPIKELAIGQSFCVPLDDRKYWEVAKLVYTQLSNFKFQYPETESRRRFAMRVSDDEKGVRVWRIK